MRPHHRASADLDISPDHAERADLDIIGQAGAGIDNGSRMYQATFLSAQMISASQTRSPSTLA